MEYHLYIVNRSDGPFKVPFVAGTPHEIQEKVNSIIQMGHKLLIPSNVVEYIDKSRLDYHISKREIRVVEKRVNVPRVGVEPSRKPLPVEKGMKRKDASNISEKKEAE